ncbi:MAG: HEAT repeat domain-containing protein [Nannocystaceae bacterium]
MDPIDWLLSVNPPPRDAEDYEELAARFTGAQVGVAFAAMAAHADAGVRAAIGHVTATALETADAELQSCGGDDDDRRWLDELVVHAPQALPLLRAQLDDAAPTVRVAALAAFAALAELRARGDAERLAAGWSIADAEPLWAALDDPDPAVRVAALGAVEHLPRAPCAALRERLDDPDPRVRVAAVPAAATHLGRAVDERLAALASTVDEPAREAASRALVDLESPRAAAALALRVGRGDLSEALLRDLADATGCEVDPAQLAALLAADRPQPLRLAAARALTRRGGPGDEEGLTSALALGDHAAIYAAIALARRPVPGSEPALAAAMQGPLPALERYSASAILMLRDAAARALGALASAEAEALLLAAPVAAKGSPRGPNARALIQALGALARPQLAPEIERRVADDLYAARIGAVALGLAAAPRSARRLRSWLDDKNHRARTHAALGLALLPGPLPAAAARALASPAPPVAATFEADALSAAAGLRALGRRGHGDPAVLRAALAWARAHRPEVDRMIACFRGRGHASGFAMAYVWILDDWLREATLALSARVDGS